MPPHVDRETLRRLLTNERLGSYMKAADGDLDGAFDLYEWNIDASSAVLSVSAMVEVVLRNALDAQLDDLAQRKGWSDWLDEVPLDPRGQKDIVTARWRASRGGRRVTHGHVVAELSLGFWRYLLARKYLTSLWIPSLHSAFPGVDGDLATARKTIEAHIEQLHFLRNRAAHHEPIHRRDLVADLVRAETAMGFIAPDAQRWLQDRESVRVVVARKPS